MWKENPVLERSRHGKDMLKIGAQKLIANQVTTANQRCDDPVLIIRVYSSTMYGELTFITTNAFATCKITQK
jgi:hypothetical protein